MPSNDVHTATPAGAAAPAWDESHLVDPHRADDKPKRVQRMFAHIARRYDLNNRLHSFGLDQLYWRPSAVSRATLGPDDRVLDVACGTGDLASLMAKRLVKLRGGPIDRDQVVGVDFTFEMLPLAARKRPDLPFITGDAQQLPVASNSVDVVSIAFGIRNVKDIRRTLEEFRRVLRPGGRLVMLEFSRPSVALVRWGNDFYTNHVVARSAALIGRDKANAYRYLGRSIDTFLDSEAMTREMSAAGYRDATAHRLTFGVVSVYVGHVE